MSFAVIKTGGKQYQVKKGEILRIEKLADEKVNRLKQQEKSFLMRFFSLMTVKQPPLGHPLSQE